MCPLFKRIGERKVIIEGLCRLQWEQGVTESVREKDQMVGGSH